MIRGFFLALLVVCYSTHGAAAQSAKSETATKADSERPLFDAEMATLPNGLRIAVMTDTRADRVRHMLWYGVGSADEPRGVSGIAHYLEHMMFKGTRNAPGNSFSKVVSRHGGRENAFTSYDVTTYHQTIPSALLPQVMQLEADRMRNLVLALDELEAERSVVLEERRMRVDNRPLSRLREMMSASLYVHNPYGTPIIGWEHEIKAMTAQDLTDFYDQHYRPSNALLIVVGNTTMEHVLKLAQATYGSIPNLSYVRPERARDPVANMARTVTLRDPQVAQDVWMRLIKADGSTDLPRREVAALSLLMDIMGGDSSSRYYQALVLDQPLATSVSAYYNALQRHGGQVTIYAAAAENTDLQQLGQMIEQLHQVVLDEGVTQEELDRVRDTALNQLIYLRDDMDRAAQSLGQALSIGLPLKELNGWPAALRAVTRDDIQAAARTLFASEDHVTGFLYGERP